MPFDINKALKVRKFIENLTFSKGEWVGQPFRLIPWQWDELVKPAFGTLRDDGYRQYRYVYVEIPKKNGKTELGAAIALYMLCADGEGKPEVYSAAGDREQAGLVYSAAAEMVNNDAILSKHLKVLDSRKRIINKRNSGFYQVLSNESELQHGLSPSAIIFDELHAQPNDRLWTVLTSGTDYARKQQLIIVLTTAGIYDKESIWWKVRSKAIQIKKGIIQQSNFLPVLYLADPEKDDSEDRELWQRVNPSVGHIFSMAKIEDDFESIKHDPVEYQNFLRFRLNIPIKSLSRWLPMGAWDKCGGNIDISALEGRYCYGGLDLSSKLDLTAFILVFPPENEDEKTIIVSKFYVPEDTILQRSRADRVDYNIWKGQGYLTATPGNTIDYAFIKKDVLEAQEKYQLLEVGFDPWGATQLANDLYNDHGVTMVEMRQGTKTLSEPAKSLLVAIMQRKVNHGNHPILRWCADNLVMVADANENIRPDKEKATDRIDGMVALIMAWGRSIFGEGASIYEKEGIEVI